jgi:hypothetical protein
MLGDLVSSRSLMRSECPCRLAIASALVTQLVETLGSCFWCCNVDLDNFATVSVDTNLQRRFAAPSSVEIRTSVPNKSIENIDIRVACCDERAGKHPSS